MNMAPSRRAITGGKIKTKKEKIDMTEIKDVKSGYRESLTRYHNEEARKQSLYDRAAELESKLDLLGEAVATAKAEFEQATLQYAETSNYKAFEAASKKLATAEAEHAMANKTFSSMIAKLRAEADGIYNPAPSLPYRGVAEVLLSRHPEIGLFLFEIRNDLKASVGDGDKLAPRRLIEDRLECGMPDAEYAKMFDDMLRA
ncbi:MAG: hypothetical protein HGB17_15310 [Syntrophobacteraceae bacterium]|nr:hypothetical protein [Syntrophobacteraceae bacterium]